MPSNPTPRLDVLRALQASTMLAGLPILTHLQALPGLMTFKGVPFADYFDVLQDEISKIPRVALDPDVELGVASSYLAELSMAYEQVIDGNNRCYNTTLAFAGNVRSVLAKATSLKGPFLVWWSVGAADIIEQSALAKLTPTDLKSLATQEFTNYIDDGDLAMAALVEALDYTLSELKASRKLADTKYAMGKDQVNALLSALDGEDRGFTDAAPRTRRNESPSVGALRSLYGDRVKDEQSTIARPPQEDDDDLPLDLPVIDLDAMPERKDVTPGEASPTTSHVPAEVPQVDAAPQVKKAGEALAVNVNLCIANPGITKIDGHTLFRNKTKLKLEGQSDPIENGLYRFAGADHYLVRLDPVVNSSPEQPKGKIDPVVTQLEDTPPVPTAPKDSPIVGRSEQVLTEDPFLGPLNRKPMPTAPEEEDNLPETQATPVEDDDLPLQAAPAEEDDDLPLTATPSTAEDAGEDDFPVDAPVINKTPASKELAGEVSASGPMIPPVSKSQVAPPEPDPVKVDIPAPIVLSNFAHPGEMNGETNGHATNGHSTNGHTNGNSKPGLFRNRTLAPGQTMAPPFPPTPGINPDEISDEDLDEML